MKVLPTDWPAAYVFAPLIAAITIVGLVALALAGSQPAHGDHCATLGNCTPACGDALGTCKVDAKDRWPISGACTFLAHHPEAEHSLFGYWQTVHCVSLGGVLVGGLTDDHCFAAPGSWPSEAPNLRSIFGAESLGQAAHRCSAATGIPVGLLSATDDPQAKEWPGGFQFCPNYASWSTYYPDKAGGHPQQANPSCVGWKL